MRTNFIVCLTSLFLQPANLKYLHAVKNFPLNWSWEKFRLACLYIYLFSLPKHLEKLYLRSYLYVQLDIFMDSNFILIFWHLYIQTLLKEFNNSEPIVGKKMYIERKCLIRYIDKYIALKIISKIKWKNIVNVYDIIYYITYIYIYICIYNVYKYRIDIIGNIR